MTSEDFPHYKRPEVVIPFIHLNGDRAETLIDNLSAVYDALIVVDRALCQCRPNGRNAYPVDGLIQKLESQHAYRKSLVRALRESVEEEVLGIQDLS